jgi:hypothetical protein
VYTIPEENGRLYPLMVILQQAASGQLVVAVRGSMTEFEWTRSETWACLMKRVCMWQYRGLCSTGRPQRQQLGKAQGSFTRRWQMADVLVERAVI